MRKRAARSAETRWPLRSEKGAPLKSIGPAVACRPKKSSGGVAGPQIWDEYRSDVVAACCTIPRRHGIGIEPAFEPSLACPFTPKRCCRASKRAAMRISVASMLRFGPLPQHRASVEMPVTRSPHRVGQLFNKGKGLTIRRQLEAARAGLSQSAAVEREWRKAHDAPTAHVWKPERFPPLISTASRHSPTSSQAKSLA